MIKFTLYSILMVYCFGLLVLVGCGESNLSKNIKDTVIDANGPDKNIDYFIGDWKNTTPREMEINDFTIKKSGNNYFIISSNLEYPLVVDDEMFICSFPGGTVYFAYDMELDQIVAMGFRYQRQE